MLALLLLATLPPCEGTIVDALTTKAIRAPRKGSEEYVVPHDQTRIAVGEALSSVLAQQSKRRPDYVFALERAALVGYELCAEKEIVLFRPVNAGHGQPVLVIRLGQTRGLIVEVPHTVFDYKTLEQGVATFSALNARALIVSGAHRCASGKPSSCDGASDACGTAGGPFRESDMAHAIDSVFQLAHVLIAGANEDDLVLSLHGMDGRGVVLSDGTMIETSSTSVVARLAGELASKFPSERILLCNKGGARDPRTEDLCGTTNVQGRHTNGAEDACKAGATRSTGRFLHLEQSPRFRKHPDMLIEALERVLP